jgi:thiol-disulfide isomerase/thioredoxin/uncharacterized membrane protein YphA (DoxX/SURF4 family)
MDLLLLVIRLFLAAVFGISGVAKLFDRPGTEKAVRDFGVPDEIASPVAAALPIVELLSAVLLIYSGTSWFGALGTLLLLAAFIGAMIYQLAQGNAPDCHCFGQLHSEPVSWKAIARNVLFAFVALFIVAQGRAAQGVDLLGPDAPADRVLLLLLVAGLAAVGFFVLRLSRQQARMIEKLDALAEHLLPNDLVERQSAGHPHDGLPIGAPFPSFELADAAGGRVSLASMLEQGRPVFLLFVSPHCIPCRSIFPDFKNWKAEFEGKLEFYLVSTGAVEENLAKFGETGASRIVLQEERELAERARARWTPTAIYVRPDGTIGSHVAAGDTAIEKLVEQIRAEKELDAETYFVDSVSEGAAPRIGEPVPKFSLSDLNGNEVTEQSLTGRKTLALFWSPSCPHCLTMMDEVRAWEKNGGRDKANLVIFSSGAEEEHADLAIESPILLEEHYKTARKLGMFGTPSGILINERGEIATELGIGASNIWSLIGINNGDHDHESNEGEAAA